MTFLVGQNDNSTFTGTAAVGGAPTRGNMLSFVASQSGTATKLFIWLHLNGFNTQFKLFICDNSANPVVLASTATISPAAVDGWYSASISATTIVAGTTYRLGFYADSNDGTSGHWGANGTFGIQTDTTSGSFSAIPGTFTGVSTNGGVQTFAMYADGTSASVTGNLVGQTTPISGGSGTSSANGSQVWWRKFTAYASGTATALNLYINNVGTSTGLLLGLYDANGNLLVSTGNLGTPTTGLNTGAIANTPIIYGQDYQLAWMSQNTLVVADDGTTFRTLFQASTFGTLPSTISIGGGSTGSGGPPSMWVSGTLGAGAAGQPLGGPPRTQMHYR